jgi:hypothetical protein
MVSSIECFFYSRMKQPYSFAEGANVGFCSLFRGAYWEQSIFLERGIKGVRVGIFASVTHSVTEAIGFGLLLGNLS